MRLALMASARLGVSLWDLTVLQESMSILLRLSICRTTRFLLSKNAPVLFYPELILMFTVEVRQVFDRRKMARLVSAYAMTLFVSLGVMLILLFLGLVAKAPTKKSLLFSEWCSFPTKLFRASALTPMSGAPQITVLVLVPTRLPGVRSRPVSVKVGERPTLTRTLLFHVCQFGYCVWESVDESAYGCDFDDCRSFLGVVWFGFAD